METMESLINSLPPDLIKKTGKKVRLFLKSGEVEECYFLGEHKDTVVISKEPYVILKPFRDIHLVRNSQIEAMVPLDQAEESSGKNPGPD